MNLPGAHQAGTCWNAFHLHPRKWMVASTAIFLFGWAAASLRASDRAGCRRAVNQWRAAPAVRHRGSRKMARSCSLKSSPTVRPVNSTLVCGKPTTGLLRGRVFALGQGRSPWGVAGRTAHSGASDGAGAAKNGMRLAMSLYSSQQICRLASVTSAALNELLRCI